MKMLRLAEWMVYPGVSDMATLVGMPDAGAGWAVGI